MSEGIMLPIIMYIVYQSLSCRVVYSNAFANEHRLFCNRAIDIMIAYPNFTMISSFQTLKKIGKNGVKFLIALKIENVHFFGKIESVFRD